VVDDLSKRQMITLHDAVIVTWPEEKRSQKQSRWKVRQVRVYLVALFGGMLFGLLFFVPVLGVVVGAAMGGIAGASPIWALTMSLSDLFAAK
jgi:uncharacterized membrane protein